MKKTLSYILAIVVCLATLCGCGDTPSVDRQQMDPEIP